jgi:hypothetical protein
MFGSNVLEIAIGLIFVYSLLSLLCATINEQVIARFLNWRATTLENGIATMLDTIPNSPTGQRLTTSEFYGHPLIQSITGRKGKPSYISSHTFALALKDLLEDLGIDLSTLSVLKPLWDQIKSNPQQQLANIEQWYNDVMDRVTGWYKRKVQLVIFFLGLGITVLLNVDTIYIITTLSNSTVLRGAFISAAQGSATNQTNTDLLGLVKSIEQLQPVIGNWSASTLPANVWAWFLKIVGLLATTFALSLGATFWFGLLRNFIRLSGPPPKDEDTTPTSK